VPKKYLYILGAAVLGYFGWKWWQKRKASEAGRIAKPTTAPAPNAAAAGA